MALTSGLVGVSAGQRAGRGNCPSPDDFYGGVWILRPERGECSAVSCNENTSGGPYVRWPRQRVAEAEGYAVLISGSEQLFGLPSAHAIPSPTSTSFDLHFASGRPRPMNTANVQAWLADMKAKRPAGKQGPVVVWDTREDIISSWLLDLTGSYAAQPSWLLRSDRTLADWAGWFSNGAQWSHCRFPFLPGLGQAINASEKWDAVQGGDGCNQTFGTGNGEWGVRIYDLANAMQPGLGDALVWYVIARTNGRIDTTFFPVGALTNMLDPDYQDFVVELCAQARTLGADACMDQHKNHFEWYTTGATEAEKEVEYWPNIPADSFPGLEANGDQGGAISGQLDTLQEFVAIEGSYSGPPEIPNGVAGCATPGGCPWRWREYSLGALQIARKHYNRAAGRNLRLRIVSPNWYLNCPQDAALWDSAYDDIACTDKWNDIDVATDETASLREIVQLDGYAVIDLGGKSPSGDIEYNSGWTYDKLKDLLEHPPAGAPAVKVLGYINRSGESQLLGTDDKVCGNPAKTNPEPGIP
jgi:hypothetical protein